MSKLSSISWGGKIRLDKVIKNQPVERIILPEYYIPILSFHGTWKIHLWRNSEKKDALTMKVKKFIDLIEEGKSVTAAAKTVGETPENLQNARKKYEDKVQQTLDTYFLNSDVKKAFTAAKLMEIEDKAMANFDSTGDPKFLKLALEAAQSIGNTQEVGIYQPKQTIAPAAVMPPALPSGLAALAGIDVPKEEKNENN